VIVPKRHRPRERVKVLPFRYAYPRHHHHYHDGHIWGLLTFTAITLMILDNLNDQQQREHELALYNAVEAPMGETIFWREGSASGNVTPVQEGTSSEGRYCREYRSEVKIGGERETIYGTACQNPDGSWEIVQ
jgi:surface antigen